MIEMKPSVPTFSQDNNIPCPYLYLYGGDAGEIVSPLSVDIDNIFTSLLPAIW